MSTPRRRTTDGGLAMVAAPRDGYDLGLIADALERIKRTVQPDGSVSIHDITAFTDLRALIASAVKLTERLPDPVRRNIVYEAISAAIRKQGITAQILLDEINKSIASYYKKAQSKYDLMTSLSISRKRRLKNTAVDGCPIHFPINLGKRYLHPRQELLEGAKYSVCGELPKHYSMAKVRVIARSELEAWERAIDALDLLRALWNLALNRGGYWRMSSGKRKPVNHLVLGPIHTLHKPNGELASNSWWYQTEYQGPISPYEPGDDKAEAMFRYANHARKYLKRSGYRDQLIACLLRYVRALDTPNWEDSYLRLWGILEQLTNTGIQDNYKVTIRRASFIWADRKYTQQILTHLRDYRNKAVHVGTENQDIETYVFQLKRHVEALIEFHLRNRFRFSTISEAAEFMDLPDGDAELDRKMRIIKAAKRFHGGSEG